jgi:site-specific recombinase XerD
MGPVACPEPNDGSRGLGGLVTDSVGLLVSSLAASSRSAYVRAMKRVQSFAAQRFPGQTWFPTPPVVLVLFVTHLFNSGLAAASILPVLSAIAFFHKVFALEDPTQQFLIKKMLVGAAKCQPSQDIRAPITVAILEKMCGALHKVYISQFEISLFKSMFALMFYGFLRIGEVTTSPNNLQFHSIALSQEGVSITFHSYKHHSGKPFTLVVRSTSKACPVTYLQNYVNVRGYISGPLYVLADGSPVSSSYFYHVFYLVLAVCKLDKAVYKPHSFRIGAATHCFLQGQSLPVIQRMGRWKSDAFNKYIRVESFQT